MVKINEFHDMDIPQEIIPKPDYDVPSDLILFMRNDPMFYRKNFFPAIDKYKENTKDTLPLESMIKRGLGQYCEKFQIETPQDELMGEGDIQDLVRQIIADEMDDLSEGVMDRVKGFISADPLFKAWKQKYKTQGENAALAYLKQNKSAEKHKEFKTMIGAG